MEEIKDYTSEELKSWITKMTAKYYCSKKEIEMLLNKYELSPQSIEALALEGRLTTKTLLDMEKLEQVLQSTNYKDVQIEQCSNAFLNDIRCPIKELKLEQLISALSRKGDLIYLKQYSNTNDANFTERDKNVFLIRQFIINYYASLHRNGASINRIREEGRLLNLIDMARQGYKNDHKKYPDFIAALDWIEFGSSEHEFIMPTEELIKTKETTTPSPSTQSYCAKLYAQNIADGIPRLAAAIVIEQNDQNALTMLTLLDQARPTLEIRSEKTMKKIYTYTA